MDNLATMLKEESVFQEYGVIKALGEGSFTIESESGVWEARPAASCLLLPQMGDKVLIAAHPSHAAYILAVLEQEKDRPSELVFQNDVTIKTRKGNVNVVAKEDINLISGSRLQVISKETGIHAQKAEISIDEMSFWGKFLDANVKSIRVLASGFESVIDLLRQRVTRSYRTIEEVEHIKADRYDCHAKSLLSLKGKYSTITASEDVKIDAERIHIG